MVIRQILTLGVLTLSVNPVVYAAEVSLPDLIVTANKLHPLPAPSNSRRDSLLRLRSNTSDTASLLADQPGVSLYSAGGVASLPVIHGLADDRLRVQVDGMDLISACANHMNSPLSYISPTNVGSIKVYAGITPVSAGGDSIGGTIQVNSVAPEFAYAGEGVLIKGELGTFYRSNNAAQGGYAAATIASDTLSLRYTGSTVRAGNYKAGAAFKPAAVSAGTLTNAFVNADEVASSKFRSDDHALNIALRHDNHLLELKLGVQSIPYQGFANQRMDMLKNDSQQINLHYLGQYDWGKLQARAYNEHTQHYMNFLDAKLTSTLGMPMNTEGKNTGFLIKGELSLSARDSLTLGTGYQRYRMSDWWDAVGPVAGMMPMQNMMTGGMFSNINNGQRDRLATFAQWDANWNPRWLSQLGVRSEVVTMNAGAVQGYNAIAYPAASYAAFNAVNRQHIDNNIDVTALARYTPNKRTTVEFGFAQKTRSPNLYERFAWSSNNAMVMHMNNWFGDGNGYGGNLNLKPEVARTLSGSVSWHDEDASGLEVKLAPYYTYVKNYIDAVRCPVVVGSGTCTAANATATSGFVNLQLVNQTARLYGADASARMPLMNAAGIGRFTATAMLNYVKGKNLTTGNNLYHIMPLNAKFGVGQRLGGWTNTLDVKFVSAKTRVQAMRNELATSGYSLLNFHSSYEWKQLRLDFGIENLLNKLYFDPLGGSYLGQRPMIYGTSVPGVGRSINTSLTVKF